MPRISSSAPSLFLFLQCAVLWSASVNAQPDPQVQKDITAAIKAAQNSTGGHVDYTKFVNVYIGTDNFGDVWYVSSTLNKPICMFSNLVQALEHQYLSGWSVQRKHTRCLRPLITLLILKVKFSTDLTGYAPAGTATPTSPRLSPPI